jgi:hypothetical protein
VTLRLTAAAALVLAGLTVFAYLHLVGRGPFATPEARHLRAMKERTAVPARLETFTFADFAALPHGAARTRYAAIERRAVSLDGYVAGMIHASDGDVHLEISAVPRRPGDPDTLYVTAEITPAFRHGRPEWSYESLRQAFRPASGGPRPSDLPSTRVRVSGWLLYDFQYDGLPDTDPVRTLWNRANPPRHPGRARRSIWPRLTGWEIHPVTGVEVWDDSLGWRSLAS